MNKRTPQMPTFKNESQEADWWASRAGRQYVKRKSARGGRRKAPLKGSRLVGELDRKSSVQVAIRLPAADLARARKLAGRKGIGYQTLVKMLLHEGLEREARRA